MNDVVKVHWCYIENFGDALNPYLISKLSGKKVAYRGFERPNFLKETKLIIKSILKNKTYDFNRLRGYNENEDVVLGIGSLLNRSRKNFRVWGTGYMNWHERAQGGTLHAVRGRFSAEKLAKEGFEYCSVWGDPAILLPLVYPLKSPSKKYELGIIPHLKDFDFFSNKYHQNNNVHIINLNTTDIESVLNQMVMCERIISTSLHGVIVGHAYKIPTLWIKHNDIDTDGLKFDDYFDSVKIEPYDGFDNFDEIIKEPYEFFIERKNLILPNNDLREMQRNLLEVAPFTILPEFLNPGGRDEK
ncbi:polysaccharide pyruvyl transferase family protein [Klebsiella sp. MISC125]|uniref:polysaccharide pyruvyl transferase family protein n=1 Tax=Klebsiella sp. MISC125 TaxID=2755386 RepID=UPI003DA8A1AF